ncbi:MAG: DNA-binding transcriptional ArsR family regulator [Planctomycetota bacterium]|jgi:DNA-binding transcriptional ArsR family regulator
MARKKSKHTLPEHLLEAVARRFRTLGVPSRLRILSALMDGPLGMAELEEATELEQSNLSRQITELEREGCVGRRRSGRSVEVEISDPSLRDLCALVCGAVTEQAPTKGRAR